MDGATRVAGAVAGVHNVKNPILLARELMQHSPHVMMSGAGADAFAQERGVVQVDPASSGPRAPRRHCHAPWPRAPPDRPTPIPRLPCPTAHFVPWLLPGSAPRPPAPPPGGRPTNAS